MFMASSYGLSHIGGHLIVTRRTSGSRGCSRYCLACIISLELPSSKTMVLVKGWNNEQETALPVNPHGHVRDVRIACQIWYTRLDQQALITCKYVKLLRASCNRQSIATRLDPHIATSSNNYSTLAAKFAFTNLPNLTEHIMIHTTTSYTR